MLKTLTATNYVGDSITIDIWSPDDSGFLITNIEGMDSPGSTINTTDIPTNDGSIYNSSRLKSRDISISLKILHPVETNRLKLYKYFPAKQPVTLTFETESRTAKVTGYVESVSIDMFSSMSSAKIGIQCPMPYFSDINDELLKYSNMEELFEFPYYCDNDHNDDSNITVNKLTHFAQNTPYGIYTDYDDPTYFTDYGVLEDAALENEETLLERGKSYTYTNNHFHSTEAIYHTTGTYIVYVKCNKYTRYLLNKTIGDRYRIAFTKTIPTYDPDEQIITPIDTVLYTKYDYDDPDRKIDTWDYEYMILYPCTRDNYIAPSTIMSNLKVYKDATAKYDSVSKLVTNGYELSSRHSVYKKNIVYYGDVETGCIFTLHALGHAKNIQIYNEVTGEHMAIKGELNAGDDLEICTIQNNKYARKISGDYYTSVLNKIVRDSDWIKIYKGDNMLIYVAEVGVDNIELSVKTEILYEGL